DRPRARSRFRGGLAGVHLLSDVFHVSVDRLVRASLSRRGASRRMNAPTSFFVTGTDTGVGKTHVSSAPLLAIRRRALKAYGYKPVASGCERRGEEWISDDAEKLRAYSTTPTPDLALMNPIALPEPIAPHLAAAHVGR